MNANVDGIRLRRPRTESKDEAQVHASVSKHKTHISGLLQDQVRRSLKAPWAPSLSLAFRMILLVRFIAAIYSNIQDCDEVFNFWEPLHFLHRGYGFQTWEVTHRFAIRSWTYISLHFLPAWATTVVLKLQKRQAFFGVRAFLAIVSSLCEAKMYRATVETINVRVGRYMLFIMLFSAGMWNSAIAFLPSTFAMYCVSFAFSYTLKPASLLDAKRTYLALIVYAAAGIVGWPFALVLAVPFGIEEMFLAGNDAVTVDNFTNWYARRVQRLLAASSGPFSLLAAVIAGDSLAYGNLTAANWNIVKYNVFGGRERGPDLYGTEPWYFYVLNLLLNFNLVFPLSLAVLPALGVTALYDKKRLAPVKLGSSSLTMMLARVAPVYLWLGIFSLQPHKEERFMFPIYPLICFNAAVTIYLARGWIEQLFIKWTNSPYRASRTSMFSTFTRICILVVSLISMSRILALLIYYRAPFQAAYHFEYIEVPKILNKTGLLPAAYTEAVRQNPEDTPFFDLSVVKELKLRICYGKEWYRFPGHYLVPEGVRVDFIKSNFDGLLPHHFLEMNHTSISAFQQSMQKAALGLNDANREDPSLYVQPRSCNYLVDLDYPHSPSFSMYEPRFAADKDGWERVACFPFLDAGHSSTLTRILWVPGQRWHSRNTFGDYCLLRNRALSPTK